MRIRNSNAKWRPSLTKGTFLYVGDKKILTRRVRWHKARVLGTVRNSRKPGGNGFRGRKQWDAQHG